MNELLLCLSITTLIGSCLLKTLQKAISNSLYVELFSFPNILFNANIKMFQVNIFVISILFPRWPIKSTKTKINHGTDMIMI